MRRERQHKRKPRKVFVRVPPVEFHADEFSREINRCLWIRADGKIYCDTDDGSDLLWLGSVLPREAMVMLRQLFLKAPPPVADARRRKVWPRHGFRIWDFPPAPIRHRGLWMKNGGTIYCDGDTSDEWLAMDCEMAGEAVSVLKEAFAKAGPWARQGIG